MLNGFVQALNGLHDFATLANDAEGRALFAEGEAKLRAELPRLSTPARGRCTRKPGAESDLGYHMLLRDFLHGLCDRLDRDQTAACRPGADRPTCRRHAAGAELHALPANASASPRIVFQATRRAAARQAPRVRRLHAVEDLGRDGDGAAPRSRRRRDRPSPRPRQAPDRVDAAQARPRVAARARRRPGRERRRRAGCARQSAGRPAGPWGRAPSSTRARAASARRPSPPRPRGAARRPACARSCCRPIPRTRLPTRCSSRSGRTRSTIGEHSAGPAGLARRSRWSATGARSSGLARPGL